MCPPWKEDRFTHGAYAKPQHDFKSRRKHGLLHVVTLERILELLQVKYFFVLKI
jgi:hypothetical protein